MSGETNGKAGQETALFSEFPPTSYEEWRKAAEKILKGAPFEKRLVTKTYEGITLQPMYRQEDVADLPHTNSLPGFPPYVRFVEASGYVDKTWEVAQELPYGTPEEFNEIARFCLKNGQTALNLVLDQATLTGVDADKATSGEVGVHGTSISTVKDLATALDGIDLEQTPLLIQAGSVAFPLAALLIAALKQQGTAPEKLNGCIGMDPLGALAHTGTLPRSLAGTYDTMAPLTAWAKSHAPGLKTILVQGQPYHDSGASAVQELAFAIATGVEYLREMQARGLSVDDVAPRMLFTFSLGSNFFMEVAKLRAARLLWANVIKAFGGSAEAQKLFMHVRTSAWNKSVYDPYVNMLRTTTEAFAGVVGGCNSMHVSSFDETRRVPDDFSRRIARNTHIILEQESKLSKLIDPAGGSWYVEKLTDEVARESWKLFQSVERQGGMFKALQAGMPQDQVEQIAQQRAKNIATRKDVFVGTNMYANLKEKPLAGQVADTGAIQQGRAGTVTQYRSTADQSQRQAALEKLSSDSGLTLDAAISAAQAGATLGELTQALRTGSSPAPTIKAMRIHRGPEIFEKLRAASEEYAKKTGSAPQVFLANIGPIPQHKPRADFSTGFFEVGGFNVLTNTGFSTAEEAAQAALASGAPVVVICSTDDTYPDVVPPLTKQIKSSKPDTTVILAGYPADQVEAHKQAGVDEFIHLRANCHDILLNLQKKIGVVS